MTVGIRINGSQLTATGRQLWVSEASVVEDSTPLGLSDSFGGVGSIQATVDNLDGMVFSQGDELELNFTGTGTISGVINEINPSDGRVGLAAETAKAALNVERRASPITTNLGAALAHYFTLCGLSSGQWDIDSGIAARTLVLPGWYGNVWLMLKEMCAVERIEIDYLDGKVVVRPIGTVTASLDAASTLSEPVGVGSTGLQVQTHFYHYTTITNQLVYPPGEYNDESGTTIPAGWSSEAPILTVSPGDPVEIEVDVMASLTSVQQPTMTTLVGPGYNSSSVYTVVTKDGVQAIDPAVWTARGGSVTVEIGEDTRTLTIRLDAGDNDPMLAPYRICLTDGAGDYSTLRIVGTGVRIEKNRVQTHTTVPVDATTTETSFTTDSMFVRTVDQARRILYGAAAASSRSVGALQGAVAGSIGTGFGEGAGAIVHTQRAAYRIRSLTHDPGTQNFTAVRHTTIADLNAANAGLTIAGWNAKWAGRTFRDFSAAPLT